MKQQWTIFFKISIFAQFQIRFTTTFEQLLWQLKLEEEDYVSIHSAFARKTPTAYYALHCVEFSICTKMFNMYFVAIIYQV